MLKAVGLTGLILMSSIAFAQRAGQSKQKPTVQKKSQALGLVPEANPIPRESSVPVASLKNQSELFHQAEAGRLELSPELSLSNTKAKYKDKSLSVTEVNWDTTQLKASIEYGLSEQFSFRFGWGYADQKRSYVPTGVTSSRTSRGLVDPTIELKGRSAMGAGGWIRYGASLSIAIDKEKYDAAGDSNQASGRTTFTPYVGLEVPSDNNEMIFGSRFTYDIYQSDQKTETEVSGGSTRTSTTKGGAYAEVDLFGERILSRELSIGGVVGVTNQAETKTESSTGSISTGSSSTSYFLGGYLPWRVSPGLTLTPRLMIGSVSLGSSSAANTYESVTAWSLSGQARFIF